VNNHYTLIIGSPPGSLKILLIFAKASSDDHSETLAWSPTATSTPFILRRVKVVIFGASYALASSDVGVVVEVEFSSIGSDF
jgi:hypothetical protein